MKNALYIYVVRYEKGTFWVESDAEQQQKLSLYI